MRHDEEVSTPKTAPRDRYHHGDLRNAMRDSAVDLARTGGPDAVVLREVARRVGVSATAAYRHFSDAVALLEEVKHSALDLLTAALVAAVIAVPDTGDAGDLAVAQLRAAANAYIDFAIAEPGLFITAFCRTTTPAKAMMEGEPFADTDSFRALGTLLDQVVAAGRMPAARRPGAEIAAWSAVHGFAVLLVDGPLGRNMSAEQKDFARERMLDVVIGGLTAEE